MSQPIPDGVWIGRVRMVARLALRIASVVLGLLAARSLLAWGYYLVESSQSGYVSGMAYVQFWWSLVMAAFYAAPAAAMLLWEPAVLRWLVPIPDRRCPGCGYPLLSHDAQERCPECGIRLRANDPA